MVVAVVALVNAPPLALQIVKMIANQLVLEVAVADALDNAPLLALQIAKITAL